MAEAIPRKYHPVEYPIIPKVIGIQKLPSICTQLITLIANGAYSFPTSGY